MVKLISLVLITQFRTNSVSQLGPYYDLHVTNSLRNKGRITHWYRFLQNSTVQRDYVPSINQCQMRPVLLIHMRREPGRTRPASPLLLCSSSLDGRFSVLFTISQWLQIMTLILSLLSSLKRVFRPLMPCTCMLRSQLRARWILSLSTTRVLRRHWDERYGVALKVGKRLRRGL